MASVLQALSPRQVGTTSLSLLAHLELQDRSFQEERTQDYSHFTQKARRTEINKNGREEEGLGWGGGGPTPNSPGPSLTANLVTHRAGEANTAILARLSHQLVRGGFSPAGNQA